MKTILFTSNHIIPSAMRSSFRFLCCALAILLVALVLPSFAGGVEKRPPNILFIMTDEHHAGMMGCVGDKVVQTPHLDALAARGILFNQQYCASPICMPSRHSFTTGKYVSGHMVWRNDGGVPEGVPTLPRILNAAGYESYLIGNMHYKGGETHGFTIIDDKGRVTPPRDAPRDTRGRPIVPKPRLQAGVFPDQGGKLAPEFDRAGEADDNPSPVDIPRRDHAIKFLRERPADSKPFFATVSFIAPHYPFIAPEEYLARYRNKVPAPEVPPGVLEALALNYKHTRNDRQFERVPPFMAKLAREAYYARIDWIDHQIGLVLDALSHSSFAENTVVIYTTDHGESLGNHGMWMKCNMFDHAARVPLIVSWPARWKGGQQRNGACGMVDLVKTVADLAAAKTPADWNGVSMLPWLDDANYAWRDLAVCEYFGYNLASGIVMIRQGDWKYVYHTRADEQHGPERELYNMKEDPREFQNLAGDPAQEARMKAMHEALVRETGEDPERTEARYRAGATYLTPNGMEKK
jgi:choline-sulfatase